MLDSRELSILTASFTQTALTATIDLAICVGTTMETEGEEIAHQHETSKKARMGAERIH